MQLLIWDFDGTLAFRRGMWGGALADVAQASIPNCRATREDFAPYLRSGFFWHTPEVTHTHIQSADEWWEQLSPVIVNALIQGAGITRDHASDLVPAVRSIFINPCHWEVFDDVLPCLEALSAQGWTHVVLSNHVPELSRLIDDLGLGHHLSQIFNSAASGYEKPHPAAFEIVRNAYPEAGRIRMIGDNYHADIAGAEAAGLTAVLVRQYHAAATAYHESLATLPLTLV